MNYGNHPLLEGFKDQPDSKLLEVAIGQLDLAAYIKKRGEGLPQEVKDVITSELKDVTRAGLEKFLYHAIVAAVEANEESRGRGKNTGVS